MDYLFKLVFLNYLLSVGERGISRLLGVVEGRSESRNVGRVNSNDHWLQHSSGCGTSFLTERWATFIGMCLF